MRHITITETGALVVDDQDLPMTKVWTRVPLDLAPGLNGFVDARSTGGINVTGAIMLGSQGSKVTRWRGPIFLVALCPVHGPERLSDADMAFLRHSHADVTAALAGGAPRETAALLHPTSRSPNSPVPKTRSTAWN